MVQHLHKVCADSSQAKRYGITYALHVTEPDKGKPMTKELDQIDEVIRNPKHPFRQVADRPEKPQKHRYERRKVREYIKLGDWLTVR